MKNEKGFTLIEMLLVLFVVMSLTGIVMKLTIKTAEDKEMERFLTQLQLDIQYIQIDAMQRDTSLFIKFEEVPESYVVKKDFKTVLYRRLLPKNVTFARTSTLKTIHFTPTGNVRQFGSLIFITPKGNKRVTINIGKGRMRIDE
ncbi:MAG: competence type IV pilus minor pilin ComGD [Lysinibacillus sp.]